MKPTLRLFAIHQITTSLQWTYNLNLRTRWYPSLDESNRMKSAYFTIHSGKNPPPQNGCRLKSVFFIKINTGFTSSTFPIQPDFSQNQPASITLNTGSPWTLHMGQEPWPWNCEGPKKSKCPKAVPQRTSNIMWCGHRSSSGVWSHMWLGRQPNSISANFHSCRSSHMIE